MAIQVSSTTVIDNSRNLNNIAGADATTVSSLESAGLGGASTSFGDVGTYVIGRPNNTTNYSGGDTATGIVSGSIWRTYTGNPTYAYGGTYYSGGTKTTHSGTWRCMTNANLNSFGLAGLWVRIS